MTASSRYTPGGMSIRDIQAHLREIYQGEVSAELVSKVTDAVVDELTNWQNRPLGPSETATFDRFSWTVLSAMPLTYSTMSGRLATAGCADAEIFTNSICLSKPIRYHSPQASRITSAELYARWQKRSFADTWAVHANMQAPKLLCPDVKLR